MEETNTTTSYEALINHLFDDDLFHADIASVNSSIFFPEESIGAQLFHDENGSVHESAKDPNPGNTAAHCSSLERRPWLKESDPANSGNEKVQPKPKLQYTPMKKKKQHYIKERTLYQKVMEEVANKTRDAFLKHYGDDSVHIRFQQLWKSKMTSKKVKLGHLAGKLRTAGVASRVDDLNYPRYERVDECGRGNGSFSKEKDPQLAPSRTTASIPMQGQSIQFQFFPADQDGNGRISKSAAHRKHREVGSSKQQPSRPWLENAGSEEPNPKKLNPRNPAKKQQLHQPWLKQNESGGFKHQQDEERDSILQCFLDQMLD